jgi:hypothetical protein
MLTIGELNAGDRFVFLQQEGIHNSWIGPECEIIAQNERLIIAQQLTNAVIGTFMSHRPVQLISVDEPDDKLEEEPRRYLFRHFSYMTHQKEAAANAEDFINDYSNRGYDLVFCRHIDLGNVEVLMQRYDV